MQRTVFCLLLNHLSCAGNHGDPHRWEEDQQSEISVEGRGSTQPHHWEEQAQQLGWSRKAKRT